MKNILTYLAPLKASDYSTEVLTADIEDLYEKYQVPIFANKVADSPTHDKYFRYHHTAGDTMSMMDPDEMDSNVVGIAAFLYILADLDTTVRSNSNIRVE